MSTIPVLTAAGELLALTGDVRLDRAPDVVGLVEIEYRLPSLDEMPPAMLPVVRAVLTEFNVTVDRRHPGVTRWAYVLGPMEDEGRAVAAALRSLPDPPPQPRYAVLGP